MGILVILGILAALVALTVVGKRRQQARVAAIVRAGSAGDLHGVNTDSYRSTSGIAVGTADATMRSGQTSHG